MATIISGSSGGTAVTTATQKILQVVQSVKTDTASVGGGTFADIGLSASITPSSSSSKILVQVQANTGGSAGFSMKTRLMRDSTAIHIGDAAGSRPRASTENTGTYSTNTNYNSFPVSIIFLDSPSTTSAVTYKVQYAVYGSFTVYINRSGSDLNTSEYDARTASSITLMEVAS
tara:strand:+ start:476 stop:997 length:522 start_codon:yes stop_codon:yes gene_type:complete